jgi:predicted DNA-binding transcriptional regulator AlpA
MHSPESAFGLQRPGGLEAIKRHFELARRWLRNGEVQMPSTTSRRKSVDAQREMNSGQPFPQQFLQKNLLQSEDLRDANYNANYDNFEDVSFLRLPEVKAVTGLSKTSIYELVREKTFPAPIRLGPRAVAWVKSEIRQWAVERVRASRSAA